MNLKKQVLGNLPQNRGKNMLWRGGLHQPLDFHARKRGRVRMTLRGGPWGMTVGANLVFAQVDSDTRSGDHKDRTLLKILGYRYRDSPPCLPSTEPGQMPLRRAASVPRFAPRP